MPRAAKWGRNGTSETPKPIDLRFGKVRLQISSGVYTKDAWTLRRNAIRESWALGGLWRDAVMALIAKRFTLAAFYEARQQGEPAVRTLMATSGSEPLKDLIRDYVKQSKSKDIRHTTQKLQRYSAALGKAPSVADVTTASVEVFLAALTDIRTHPRTRKRPYKGWVPSTPVPAKGSTINRYRAAIGGLCTWAVKKGRMTEHPIAGKKVEKYVEPHHRLPEMSADEYRDYMATARAKRPDVAVVLLLLIHTGCDIGELVADTPPVLAVRDVDFERGRIRYDRPKTIRYGSLPRYVPMPAVVVTEMKAHVAEYGVRGEQPAFGMFKRSDVEWLHRQAAQSIQRPKLTIKDLRHVAAISWVKAGTHIRLVMKWLGHRSLSQTMRYTDYEPDDAAASEMAERAASTLTKQSIPDSIPREP